MKTVIVRSLCFLVGTLSSTLGNENKTNKSYVDVINCRKDRSESYAAPFHHDQPFFLQPVWADQNYKDNINYYIFNYIVFRIEKISHSLKEVKFNYDIVLGNRLEIPPYSAVPGWYYAGITAYKKDGSLKGLPSQVFLDEPQICFIYFIPYEPAAIIEGGSSRVVDVFTDIIVDGRKSYDINHKNNSNEGLSYNWSCTQKIDDICYEGMATSSFFELGHVYLRKGDEINMTLTVRSIYGTEASTSQIITVKAGVANVRLICRKNCPPVIDIANTKYSTFIEAVCDDASCSGVDLEQHVIWEIKSLTDNTFDFDYGKYTRFGKVGRKFMIEKRSLKPGIYIISVSLVPWHKQEASASIRIEYGGPANVKSCEIMPKSGHSLQTYFSFSCIQIPETERNFYEIYSRDKKNSTKEDIIADGYNPEVFTVEFVLPPSEDKTFFVRVSKVGRPEIEIPVEVQVETLFENKSADDILETLKKMYEGKDRENAISELVTSDDPVKRRKGLQIFQTMVNELINCKVKDEKINHFIHDFKFQAVEDLINSPVTTVNEILQLSETITSLHEHNKSIGADPELAVLTTKVCQKMSQKFVSLLKDEKYPHSMSDKSQKFFRVVSKCLETHSTANHTLISPIILNVTTSEPVIEEPVITENYANYIDYDEKYYENIEHLKDATENTLNASVAAGKAISLTMAAGEGMMRQMGKTDSTVVLKDEGKNLVETPLTSHGVLLIPPQEFIDDDHIYNILMTTWNKDIMWWNQQKIRVSTDIASIEFMHSTCEARISTFQIPVDIYFKIDNSTHMLNDLQDTYIVPEGHATMSDIDLNYEIKIYRIAIPQLRQVHIKFYNVSHEDSLDMVVTNFSFPTIEDFEKNKTLKSDKVIAEFTNEATYSILVYIGLLPKRSFVGTSVTFNVEWFTTSCIHWNGVLSKWEPTCKPGKESNYTVINCECLHFSVVAGQIESYDLSVQKVMKAELELKIVPVKIIFLTVCATYVVFYILLALAPFIQRKKQIFFLADNIMKQRFVYLLIVKTGMGYNAGTTSNVVIRLTGEKNSSEPHVLNYPDPELFLLQQFGEDMFALTTHTHLGNLKELELWFDCIGTHSNWFCREILVYDMQQRTQWIFSVKNQLSVIKGVTYIKIKPTEKNEKSEKYRIKFHLSQRYHTWYLFHHEEHLTYLKKLTIVLSNILTNYFFVLLFFKLPTFEMRDFLEPRRHYLIGAYIVFVAFASSFPVFILHIGIAWCFRVSQLQFTRYRNVNKLPFKVNVGCWATLIFLIIFSTSFLIIYGFWVRFYASLIWLTASGIGIGFGIFIYESIFALFQNRLIKIKLGHNIERMFDDLRAAIEEQRKYLYQRFGPFLLRPYFQHLYIPLGKKEIQIKVFYLKQRLHIITEFQDLIMFGVYVVILYVIVLANKDILVVQSKTEMTEMLQGVHTGSMSFDDVHTIKTIYNYINKTLIPVIQPITWYGNYVISEPALMIDVSYKVIGVVRIRQQRMKYHLCNVAKIMSFLNMTCWPEFDLQFSETGTHGYAWSEYSPYMSYDRMRSIWEYMTETETETFAHFGEFATYSGGGYVVYLGRTLFNSYANFQKIFTKSWIDEETRAVFIEFLTYNTNYNIFNSAKLVFEYSASGFMMKSIYVYAVRMLFIGNEVEQISFVFFLLFVIWVGLLFLQKSIGTIKNIRSLHKHFWLMIDLLIIALSVMCICLFIIRVYLVGQYLYNLERVKHNEFLSYFYLFYIEDFLGFVAAFLVCVATVRLWKFLRFALKFRILEKTLSIAGAILFSLALVFFLTLMTFAIPLLMILGNHYKRVHTIIKLVRLMTTMALKPLEMRSSGFLQFKLAVFFITVYMVVLQVTMWVFITIIVMAYFNAQMELSSEYRPYNIYTYLEERIQYIPRYFKYKFRRLKGGVDENFKVWPKSDKFIYSSCKWVLSRRMKFMKYITQCVLKHKIKYEKTLAISRQDTKLMLNICKQLLIKPDIDEIEVFYQGRVYGERLKFVDEKRIEYVANIVNLLLQEELPTFSVDVEQEEELQTCVKIVRKCQNTFHRCNAQLILAAQKFLTVEAKILEVYK